MKRLYILLLLTITSFTLKSDLFTCLKLTGQDDNNVSNCVKFLKSATQDQLQVLVDICQANNKFFMCTLLCNLSRSPEFSQAVKTRDQVEAQVILPKLQATCNM